MSRDEGSLIEKIQARRAYADCLSPDSDGSDRSPEETRTELNGEKLAKLPLGNFNSTKKMEAQNIAASTTSELSKAEVDTQQGKQRDEEEFFQTLIAEPVNDSEEENDRVHTCIDFNDAKFKAPGNDKPFRKNPFDIPDNLTSLPCDIFFLNNKTCLQRFHTFDELSEYLVSAAVNERCESNEEREMLKNLVRIPVKNAEHFITMGEYLRQLYVQGSLIDVVLDVQGKTFYAHRVALSCNSDYFADFFAKAKGDKCPYDVRIKGVTSDAFAAFLEYCYTGEIHISPEFAADILIMADFLRVASLKERRDMVARNLPLDQIVKMLAKNKGQTTGKLYTVLIHKVLTQFKAASLLEPFLKMDLDLLCQMLDSDELVVVSEFEVYTIVVRWIVHDLEARVKYTMQIMALVRFYYMSRQELFQCVEMTSLVRGYDKFREMVLIALWLQTADSFNREDPFKFPRPRPRKCYIKVLNTTTMIENNFGNHGNNVKLVMAPPVMTSTPKAKMVSPIFEKIEPNTVDIFVVGGFSADENRDESKYVERYDVTDNQWLHYSGLPAPRRHHAVALLDDSMYLIGGSEPYSKNIAPVPTNTVYRMNLQSKKWTQVCDMNVYRHSHCACAVKGHIYVIGGKGKYDSILLSVEAYDPETGTWDFVPSLPEPLFGASAAALGNRIIVAGGIGANKDVPSALHVLNTVFSYDTATTSWTRLRNLKYPRCLATLVNVNDTLYLCGGATRSYDVKNSVLCSISSVDEYDAIGDVWYHVADMVIPRHDAGAAVAGNRIYMIGGISTPADRVLHSIECYDTASSVWISGVQDLPYPGRWICCCSVPSKFKA